MNTIKDPILAQVDDSMVGGLILFKADIGGFNQRFPEFRINKLTWPSEDTYSGVVEHKETGRQFKIEVTPDTRMVDEIAPFTPTTSEVQPIQYNTGAKQTEQTDWGLIVMSIAIVMVVLIGATFFLL